MQTNFIEISLRHGCSPVNLLHIFRTPFLKNTSGRLLPFLVKQSVNYDELDEANYVELIYYKVGQTLYYKLGEVSQIEATLL